MANTLELHQLPSTKDELTQHIIRVTYQPYVWKRALETKLDIPTPTGHGCKRKEINSVVWMENQQAPESVLKFIT